MGVDKTTVAVDGRPLLGRVIDLAVSLCAHTMVVTNRPDSVAAVELPEGVRVVTDDVAWQGPLGGLATALAHAEDEWVLALGADMPYVHESVVRRLWEARGDEPVVAISTPDGPQPLLALYRRDALETMRRLLSTGRRRAAAVLRELPVLEVPAEELRKLDPSLASLIDVDTPDDLAAVEEAGPLASEIVPPARAGSPGRALVVDVGSTSGRRLPVESPITIYLGEEQVATIQATPDDLPELAVGFLVSEGLLTDRDSLSPSVTVDHKRGLVYVTTTETIDPALLRRERYITAGCGKGVTFSSVGHALGIEPVVSSLVIESTAVYELVGQMARGAIRYRDTGGMHACALARGGVVEIVREDVGRHNAVDKTLGRAWLDRLPTEDAVLVTTGRISYEMAVKAAKARVPIVVSRTAVTGLAAEVAERAGVTLVGYARGGRMNVYTHPERIRLAAADTAPVEPSGHDIQEN